MSAVLPPQPLSSVLTLALRLCSRKNIHTVRKEYTGASSVRHNDVAVTLIYERRFEMEMIHIVDKTTQITNIVRYLRVLNRLSYEHFERIVLYSAIHMQNSYKARVQR